MFQFPGFAPLWVTNLQLVWFSYSDISGSKVLFTFPSQYWFTIGLLRVFSLTGWCRQIPTRRLRPRGTQDTTITAMLTFTGLSPSMVLLSKSFNFKLQIMLWSYNPATALTGTVWASPLSLATT